MRVIAGMLTHNAVSTGRMDLAKEAAWSLASEADELLVLDNASTDGTEEWVQSIGGYCYQPDDGNHTTGRGMNHLATACAKRGDIIVPTADDMLWRPGWRAVVEEFWAEADERVALFCGLLEPEYPWSVPMGGLTVGSIKALLRPTVPGGGWTMRAADWLQFIGPLPETKGYDDVPTCRRLVEMGYLLAACDLAVHAGEDRSIWGNKSWQYARPLNTQGFEVTSTSTGSMDEDATLSTREAL